MILLVVKSGKSVDLVAISLGKFASATHVLRVDLYFELDLEDNWSNESITSSCWPYHEGSVDARARRSETEVMGCISVLPTKESIFAIVSSLPSYISTISPQTCISLERNRMIIPF